MSTSPRRRPATRKGRPVLTRDIIATKALELAGVQGFQAITMRGLAGELGVTVRALYNYVPDRRQIVDLAIYQMIDSWEPPVLRPEDWQASIGDYAQSLRRLYRRWPRALLVSIDEDEPPASIHPKRLIILDRFLALLDAIGLDARAALDVHRQLALLVIGFSLMVDHLADRKPNVDDAPLVPEAWLAEHAELDIPALREAISLPVPTPDEQFDQLIAVVVAQVRAGLEAR